MDIKAIKNFAKLNRQMYSIENSGEEKSRLAEFADCIRKTVTVRHGVTEFNNKMEKEGKELLSYQSMSLFYWALVCIALILPLYAELLKSGTYVVNEKWGIIAYCIIPAALLLARIIFGVIHGRFVGVAQLVLLIICVVLGAIVQLTIFGSNTNWFLVFIAVGTVITVIGRISEYHKRIKGNMKWYRDNVKLEDEANALAEKAGQLYSGLANGCARNMKASFPSAAAPDREPWFINALEMKRKKRDEYLRIGSGDTAFAMLKEQSVYETGNERYRSVTYEKVSNQQLGYESLTAAEAKKLIAEKKFYPLFGMAIPEFSEELVYEQYRHVFDMSRDTYTVTLITEYYSEDNPDFIRARSEFDSIEERYLGTSAWNAKLHTSSAAANYMLDEYQRKKDAILDSIPRKNTYSKDKIKQEEYHTGNHCDEIACVKITTPDGELVGLYCPDKSGAVKYSMGVMEDMLGADIHEGLVPVSSGQRKVLFDEFFSVLAQ